MALKRSWLVYNPSLTTLVKQLRRRHLCEDDIYTSYQSAASSQSKTVPLRPQAVVRCALKLKQIIILARFFVSPTADRFKTSWGDKN